LTDRSSSSLLIVLLLTSVLLFSVSSIVVPGVAHAATNSGTAVPNVSSGSPPITVTIPAISIAGTTVTITGTGWNTTGDSCSLTALAATNSKFFITSTSCTITTSGVLTAHFTVAAGSQAGNHYVWVNDTGRSGVGVAVNEGYNKMPFQVVPAMVASPSAAVAGTAVAVYGSGFTGQLSTTPTPTPPPTCKLHNATSGTAGPVPASGTTCAEYSDGTLSGLFNAASVPVGFYVINATDYATPNATAFAPFTLTGSPTSPWAAFSVGVGTAGTSATVTGANWNPSDTSITFSDNATVKPDGGGPLWGTPLICTVSSGVIGSSCSFTVRTIAIGGVHNVTATGTLGDNFTLQFIVQSIFTLTPASGKRLDTGTISGTGFKTSAVNATCTQQIKATSYTFDWTDGSHCEISSSGVLTGVYKVATNATGGLRTISINNATLVQQGSYSVIFAVTATVTLTPSSGVAGANILVSGSNFDAADTTCTLSSSPSGLLTSAACAISGGGIVSGSFIVASGANDSYTVTVTGTTGDTGVATFTAGLSATLVLNPTSGQVSTAVAASGSNYLGTVCILTASPSSLFSSQSCAIAGGSLTGSFTVALGASPGTAYTVGVQTNAADSATATFTVTAGPSSALVLSPTSGPIGTVVSGIGSGFPTDLSCVLSSSPSGLFVSPSCAISGGSATVGFTVSSGASPGTYVVLATGNTGRSATATFLVTATPLFGISANPSSVVISPGGTATIIVTVSSSGGFSSPVTLAAPLPTGVTGGFSPNPVTPPSGSTAESTLSIGAATGAPTSTTAVTITGTSGTSVATAALTIVIQATVTTETATSVSTTSGAWTPPSCVIATATFGSEASPAVQFLRNFRDNLVLSTTAGSAFMQVFNAWYYSFSPSVAQFIASNDPIRAPIRVFLYPLLGVLSVSAFTYSLFSATPEFGIVVAGLVASSLIGLVYLTLPVLVSVRALRKRRVIAGISIARIAMASLATALLLIAVGEFAQSFVLLAVGSSALVLTCIIAAPVLVTLAILRTNPK
jgi:hypothetical protein